MAYHIVCNPAGIGYTIANVTVEHMAAAIASGSEQFVPYDPIAHAAWGPGDVHDGKGGFSTPPLSDIKRATAHAVLDEHTASLHQEALAEAQAMSRVYYVGAKEHVAEGEKTARAAGCALMIVNGRVLDISEEGSAIDLGATSNWNLPDEDGLGHNAKRFLEHRGQISKIRAEIDAAKTHHDLPDLVRHHVRGWPDGHDRMMHERVERATAD